MKYINKTRFFSLIISLTLLFSFLLSYAKSISTDISNSVVRLHVVANSNSDEDQALKLKVRDRIISETSHIFQSSKSSAQALSSAKQNSNLIRRVALDEIRQNGFDYDVSVSVGKSTFPTKVYDNITLPSGKYDAVKVQIGDASGENWWCVMYPPLCFTSDVISVSDEARKELRSSLSPSNYELITKTPDSAIPVEIRFRIVEIFQGLF